MHMHRMIEQRVIQLGKELKKIRLSLVTAESCTGGGLSYFIARNEKCSSFLERGFITYSNKAKEELLEVKPYTLQTYGAVSKETAQEMAEGALKNSKAQIGVALTGIAGPDTTPSNQSEGILWIGLTGIEKKTQAQVKKISGNRKRFCYQAIATTLEEIIHFIKN